MCIQQGFQPLPPEARVAGSTRWLLMQLMVYRSTPKAGHELNWSFQRDQTSPSWDLHTRLADVQHSCSRYGRKICCSREIPELLHIHECNVLLTTLWPMLPGKHRHTPYMQCIPSVCVNLVHLGQQHVYYTWFTAVICMLIWLTPEMLDLLCTLVCYTVTKGTKDRNLLLSVLLIQKKTGHFVMKRRWACSTYFSQWFHNTFALGDSNPSIPQKYGGTCSVNV